MHSPRKHSPRTLHCAISPDADDLFMFRALLDGHVDTRGLDFVIETKDTDALNRMATGDGPDVTAISIAWYPRVAAHYRLLAHGGSVGRGYGPVLIAPDNRLKEAVARRDLSGRRVGVPGLTTTANLVLRLHLPFEPVEIPITPHQRVFEALRSGEVDAAVVIHEGRLTYAAEGFSLLLDLGVAWEARTGLPLPLGGNVIRRDLPPEVIADADAVIRESIAHALRDREAAIDWLLARGGALKTREAVDRYLSMYANADTLDYGADGRAGIRRLLEEASSRGWLPAVEVDFVGD